MSSMMEDWKKDTSNANTADSDYFHARNRQCTAADMRNVSDYTDPSLPQALEEQVSRLRESLATNDDWIAKLKSKEDLTVYVQQSKQELLIQQAKSQAEVDLSKQHFEKGMGQLQRKLGSYRREWKQLKQNNEKQLSETIDQLKTTRKQNQAYIATLVKQTSSQVHSKLAAFGKQLKTIRKSRMDKKDQLMQQVEYLRGTLQQRVEAQKKNRTEYESIVLTLLDKTCNQGEHLLRRIC